MHRNKLYAVALRVLGRGKRQPITLDFSGGLAVKHLFVVVLGFKKAPAVIVNCKPVLIEIPF
jgi:hypothetical protein